MSSLQQIADILERECQLYSVLLDLSRKKTQVIVDARISELEKLVEAEQRLIFELGDLEDKREEWVADFARQQGMEPKDITISYIASLAEGALKDRLKQLQEIIYDIIDRQKQVNQVNERLIRNNLEFIDFSLGVIAGREQAGGVYKKTGETGSKHQGYSLIDKKV
jgi:flagellar biosynthesis/type III secretory pathway chaperone